MNVTACCSAMPTSNARSGISSIMNFKLQPGHGRGHPHDAPVRFRQLDDAEAKDVLKLRRLGRVVAAFENLARLFVEQTGRVPFCGTSFLRRGISCSFSRHHVQQLGTGDVFQIGQHLRQVLHIVTIDRPEVLEVQTRTGCFASGQHS